MVKVKLLKFDLRELNGNLKEIVYLLEDGEWGQYYRVVKLLRLLRTPRELSQIETLLEMHRDVMASFKQFTKARLILLASYSKRMGLVWTYGVAVWSYDLKEAEEWADKIFTALKAVLKGTYRQSVFRELTVEEASEILRILRESDSVIALAGLPEPRDSYSRSPARGYMIGVRMIEMVEEVVRGLVAEKKEFIYQVQAQPVDPEKLLALLNKVNDLLTKYSTYEETASLGLYVSLPLAYTRSIVYSSGRSIGRSHGRNISKAHSLQDVKSESKGLAESEVHGKAETEGIAEHESYTRGIAETEGWSHQKGIAKTEGKAHTTGIAKTTGTSASTSVSESKGGSKGGFSSWSESMGGFKQSSVSKIPEVVSETTGKSETTGGSFSETESQSHSSGGSKSWSVGVSGKPFGVGVGGKYGESGQWMDTKGSSQTETESWSESKSESLTKTKPYQVEGEASGVSWQKTQAGGKSWSSFSSTTTTKTASKFRSETKSESWTESESKTVSEVWGEMGSVTKSESWTRGTTKSRSTTVSESKGVTRSKAEGVSRGEGFTEATGESLVDSQSRTYAVSEGGIWGMSIVPGLNMSVSARRLNEAKRTVYELLSLERQRFLEALSSGGFYVQAVVLGNRETVEAAKSLILGSYTPTKPSPEPLYIVEGDADLLLAAKTLSLDLRKDDKHPIRVYRVVNLYTATELGALTHPPRVQVRGVETIAENVPEFSLPNGAGWDIELGWALSHETLQPEVRWGYNLEELGHVGVFGASGSGKTVFSTNLAYQLAMKGFKVVVIDWKFEWRRLLNLLKNARFFALYEHKSLPKLRWNPLRPPKGVPWREWMRVVLEWFVVAYGLGSRSMAVMRKHLWSLYTDFAPSYPSLKDLYESILGERDRMAKRKVSFDKLDIYDKILDRLWAYSEGDLKPLFGEDSETDIVELVLENDFIDFEAGGMADTDKPFILSLIVFALYYYAKHNGPYRTPILVVIEEAHQVAFDVKKKYSAEAVNITEDVWGKLAAEGRAYNLYGAFIVQYPSRLNPMVLANLMNVVAFRLNLQAPGSDRQDVFTIVYLLGKDPVRFANEYARFLQKMPPGNCITVKKKVRDFFEAEPVLVKADLFEPLI